MADIELVIKILEEAKQAFDCAESNDLKGCYYDHGGIIGNAIKYGKPLDAVLDEIRADIEDWQTDIHDNEYDAKEHDFVFERIFEIIDEYKAESEDEE